jgi:hypothetical protein
VDVASHARYALPLEGAHRAIPCVACHAEMTAGKTAPNATLVASGVRAASLPFTAPIARTCATCHATPHGAQFANRPDAGNCASCHSLDSFAPAPGFDHESARFSLKGAHAQVACAGCHKRVPIAGGAPGAMQVLYRPLSTACESCHTARPARGSR